ncbi:hypothetical protein [Streptomyces sp. NPDC046909]|uniref:effector-associated constant component EACC1 n=1 Tax=Streptomyces sp. NPDC046909 TaxID=3155617 RepID=UPI0033F8F580
MAYQGIRVRLDGTASEGDIGALRKWLEREQRLDEKVRAGELHIQERPRTDETGAPMGIGMDIVVAMAGGAGAAVAKDLLEYVKRSVAEWRDVRRGVEDGDPPSGRVDLVDLPDDR